MITGCIAVAFLAGCAAQRQSKLTSQICSSQIDRYQAMHIAQEVLAEMHFTIEKADTEFGVLSTTPLAGAQFFEFWRSDNVGSFNTAEANLHTIRRTVRLNLSQQDGQLCIECDVKTQRLNLPERHLGSGTRAYEMFSESKSSKQILKLSSEQRKGMVWVDLGRDSRLETEIVRRIDKRIITRGTRFVSRTSHH